MFGKRIKIKELLAMQPQGQEVTVMGWVRTFRNNQFVALNDGSANSNLQVVIELGMLEEETLKRITTSASLKVTGTLIASLGRGQSVEVKAATVEILGDSDAARYPLQLKNKPTLEYLREIAHLRFRTNTFGAVFRIRHALAFAVHRFFNERGFVYLHTPIITASDAEGAGEMFRVSTLDLKNTPFRSEKFRKVADLYYNNLIKHIDEYDLFTFIDKINQKLKSIPKVNVDFKSLITSDIHVLQSLPIDLAFKIQLGILVSQLFQKLTDTKFFTQKPASNRKGIRTELPEWLVESINPTRKGISAMYKVQTINYLLLSFYNYNFVNNQLRNSKDRQIDFSEDFFGRATNLTVSGQLEGELGATAFGEIYTFGPTFRAENSNTARHLAEFWMIEPEMAFFDLEDNANLAEAFIQYIIRYAMEHNADDIEALRLRLLDEEKGKPQQERSELDLLQKLQFVTENSFERVTYTEAIAILLQSSHYKKGKFQYDVSWGIDMQSEHERYLVEKHFRKPVIVTGYPKEIKAFYMRQNDDGKTVAAMDILAPGIGEIVGGSQREERLDKLETRMKEMGIPVEEMWWYLDTRRFGTVPHAGFGLGFERMVQFVTGMGNIRDVIPFPRTPKSAEF